jgi:hypothetical protein
LKNKKIKNENDTIQFTILPIKNKAHRELGISKASGFVYLGPWTFRKHEHIYAYAYASAPK